MTASRRKLRWFQFSLRTLLVFVTLVALACSWLAVKMKQEKRQREAVAAIQKLGGHVEYDWQRDANGNPLPDPQPPGPAWLRRVLGDYFFTTPVRASLGTDVGLEHVEELTQLKELNLGGLQIIGVGAEEGVEFGDSKVTDAGLKHIKGLTRLQSLNLDAFRITDAGLENLKGLTRLQALDLDLPVQVTDAGLEHLKGLRQLKDLWLDNGDITHLSHITTGGVRKLQQALPNCKIHQPTPASPPIVPMPR
jgi:hypothetical protein